MRDEWLGDNRTGLAILRVSTRKQLQGVSHDVQEAEIRAYCDRHGIELAHVVPIAESAKDSDNRKRYTEAVNRALADNIGHILFYMHDREARNLTDCERNEKLVLSGLVVLHYVRDQKVLHAGSPETDFLMRDFQAVQNKHFSRVNRAKVIDAMRAKAEAGWYPSNWPPLGYAIGRVPGVRYQVPVRDPDERKVRQINLEFQLRAEGLSYAAIRERVISEGLIPEGKEQAYSVGVIQHRIMNCLWYEGKFEWGGKVYEGKHELVVPLSLVQAARDVRRAKKTTRSARGVLAGGWLRCAECDCAIVYEPRLKVYRNGSRQEFRYYRCSNGRRAHDRKVYVPEKLIWEGLAEALRAIALPPDLAALVAEAVNASERDMRAAAARKATELKAQEKALVEREDRLTDLLIAGDLDREAFSRQRERLRSELSKIRARVTTVSQSAAAPVRETALSIIQLCMSAKDLYFSRSEWERREFLEKLISNPRLRGRSVEFDLKKPFDALAGIGRDPEWPARIEDFLTSVASIQSSSGEGFRALGRRSSS